MPTAHRPLRIAHRGMPRQAPENTLASFSLALEAGADGIELDVHTTADGVVVVHHDPDVSDGTPLHSLTFEALRSRERSRTPPIPALGEVCSLVAGRAELFVEIKGKGIEREVVAGLSSYAGRFAIHSFDHGLIARLSALGSGVRLGVLIEHRGTDVAALMDTTGALDVWPHYPLVTAELVSFVHDKGGRVLPWTVNRRRDVERVTALGVDGICTDDVTRLVSP